MPLRPSRHHLRGAVPYVLGLPAAEETGRRLGDQNVRKAHEGRRLTKEAAAFEHRHGLPPLMSPAGSTRQLNFGRRCRFQMLRDLPQVRALFEKRYG